MCSYSLISFLCSADFWKIATPVIANILITIFNIWISRRTFRFNRDTERDYQAALYLYKSLLVDRISNFITYQQQVASLYAEAREMYLNGHQASIIRTKVESCCEKLDQINKEIEVNLLLPLKFVGNDVKKKISKNWDTFYDASTDCITELTGVKTPQLTESNDKKFDAAVKKFLDEMSGTIKKSHPKHSDNESLFNVFRKWLRKQLS